MNDTSDVTRTLFVPPHDLQDSTPPQHSTQRIMAAYKRKPTYINSIIRHDPPGKVNIILLMTGFSGIISRVAGFSAISVLVFLTYAREMPYATLFIIQHANG